jgi:hypothetical protein
MFAPHRLTSSIVLTVLLGGYPSIPRATDVHNARLLEHAPGLGQAATVAVPPRQPAATTALPNRPEALKFCVLGDFGTGERSQYELAEQMATLRQKFPFQLVTLVGDNLYGSERPQDFKKKFETPYKALLDADVKFYASLGNHDAREQRYYKLFNMDGKL